ncbi:MAG: protein translocase subunit SecF [Clostridia bacterium]|nr:protein translocase subunit SecF [Clostridia bacterium]
MKKSFDFVACRKRCACISLVILVLALIFNVIFGTEMDISFKGGTLVRYSFTGTIDLDKATDAATQVLNDTVDVRVETVNNTEVLSISLSEEISTEKLTELDAALQKALPDNKPVQFSSNTLQASMGRLFFIKCLVAVALAACFLLLYVGFRFRKIGGLSAGMFALLALAHDLLIVYFAFVIFRIPLNDNFVAVMLTILGYSLNDTIVIYDRIRENRKKLDPKMPIADVVNLSLNQSFVRTRNTSITTGIAVTTIAVIAIVLQMDSILSFALPMLFGVISGFYSSVFLSSPLWALWIEHKEKKAKK